ncbi:hypothetical protein M0R88_01015 [Halorussus gelatinilyticus]|uniref:Uncharacterized protein n=1 Tax=Halorussus gelatinilyticus TaxID=2937524 RepID=A0A8U0IIS2_9EURY|nr:hypothetical protein [Halorussus gelatinilyticus]UPW00698.1 hypothetical protein M0R88_01015 [Halorussus gelatinilyticus]
MSREIEREIRLVEYDDGEWSATDEDADVTVYRHAWEDAVLQLDLETGTSPIDEAELDEQTAEELEAAVQDVLSDTEEIEAALEDIDESELDDDSEYTV